MTKKEKTTSIQDLRAPGFWETIRETFLGVRRPFDCLQIEVTSRCPGRCTYCPRTVLRDSWLNRDLEWDTAVRLWPLMRKTDRVHLQGWGEPMLHRSFFDLVALARKAGALVSTTTCGLTLTPDLAKQIVRSGMDIIAFSLTGTDSISNASRQGLDFDKVYNSIRMLQSIRKEKVGVHLEIHIAYLLLASELNAVARLPELMRDLGVHAAVISTLDLIPSPDLASEAITPDDSDTLKPAREILEKAAKQAHDFDLDFHYELPDKAAAGNNCRENIQRSLFVSADGSVSPCVYVNIPARRDDSTLRVFGNVREEAPWDIWEKETFRSFRDRLAQGKPPSPCQNCPKRASG